MHSSMPLTGNDVASQPAQIADTFGSADGKLQAQPLPPEQASQALAYLMQLKLRCRAETEQTTLTRPQGILDATEITRALQTS